MRELYRKEGGAFPDPILNLTWNYTNPTDPDPGGTGKGDQRPCTGRGEGCQRCRDAASRASCSTALRNCGTTAPPHAAAGFFRAAGPRKATDGAARRDRSARAGHRAELGVGLAGQSPNFVQPRQRRPGRKGLESEEAGHRVEWHAVESASMCPTTQPTTKPSDGVGPFIMHAEGLGAPVRPRSDARGAVPRALRTVRDRHGTKSLHPKVASNPVARVFADDMAEFGKAPDFPYVGTTYRLTEHFHFWTKHGRSTPSCSPRNSSRSAKFWPGRRGSHKATGCAVLKTRLRRMQGVRDKANLNR